MRSNLAFLLLASSVCILAAQQPAKTSPSQAVNRTPLQKLPYDPAKLVNAVRASYYHPDGMSVLDCAINIDWPSFSDSAKLNLPPDRLKMAEGMKMHSHAVRGKAPVITFDWSAGSLSTSDQIEGGFKQMLGGFYQIYWPMIAAPPIASTDVPSKIEPLENGAKRISFTDSGSSVVLTVDNDNTPTHYAMDLSTMKVAIDPEYTSSPRPVPGDLRRLSGLKVNEQFGASTINMGINLDYQQVDGFNVPQHVAFNISGAFVLNLEFTDCEASKDTGATQ